MNGFNIGNIHVKLPIVQGGMGVCISLSNLASAVANQGGIGVISAVGIGMTEPGYRKNFRNSNKIALEKQIINAKSLSNGIIGVNIMMAVSDFDDLFRVAVDQKIDLIIVGAGLFLKLPETVTFEMIENAGTKLVPKVSSAKAARLIFDYWLSHYGRTPDAVVVEGPLAGGHLGFKASELTNPNFSLEKLITDTVAEISKFEEITGKEIPVIAGGGIYTGEEMYKIMQLGAKAVKMGSRFVPTFECDASIDFKNMYINASESDTMIIQSPVGLPGRVIRNTFVDEIMAGSTKPIVCPWKCLKTCDYKKVPYCIAEALFNAAQGNLDQGFAFSGAKGPLATKIISVEETINAIISEYEAAEKGN
jgi:NAD(P)H-dependent flavin oxidoreductase YrpB (nitropropane dioxygenase family)